MADRGRHTFTYAVHPHEGGLGPSTTRHARHLNAPHVLARVPVEGPAFVVEPEGVLLDSVMVDAESGDLILRLYESAGIPCVASVSGGLAGAAPQDSEARRVTLLLDDLGPVELERIPLRPFEIVTLRVP